MKTRIALLAASFALIAGCGDEGGGGDGGEPFVLPTGTYAVTNATATGADQCGLLSVYTDPAKVIGIVQQPDIVVGAATTPGPLTFNLANDSTAAANTLPTGTRNVNAITVDTEANYTAANGNSSCTVRIVKSVTGDVTADNVADLVLTFSFTLESGSCPASDFGIDALPCSSTYHFTATKQ